ncbi:MAG TPA: diadenylate cyclase CdaA [Candidatus Polarisedimenticolia bacterium]|nr:diadenylate cyclase CdaA [Candidatus Polarisedimenticolia bacterium]
MIESLFPAAGPWTFGWRDALDILLMTALIYNVGLLLRGTRAFQVLVGALVLLLAYWATGPDKPLRMVTFHQVLGNVLFYAPFAAIVLFQTAIRRALAALARTSVLRLSAHGMTAAMVDEILAAVATLAARRIGALLVIEREQSLPDQIESGIPLDATITQDLIVNIANPGSPLHDGAIILGEGRVRAASCFLPVTTDPRLSREYGSRHRAAIGLTEEYDSVAIVVSEERGTVRAAVEGMLSEPLDAEGLRVFLRRHLELERIRRGESGTGPRKPSPETAGTRDGAPRPDAA